MKIDLKKSEEENFFALINHSRPYNVLFDLIENMKKIGIQMESHYKTRFIISQHNVDINSFKTISTISGLTEFDISAKYSDGREPAYKQRNYYSVIGRKVGKYNRVVLDNFNNSPKGGTLEAPLEGIIDFTGRRDEATSIIGDDDLEVLCRHLGIHTSNKTLSLQSLDNGVVSLLLSTRETKGSLLYVGSCSIYLKDNRVKGNIERGNAFVIKQNPVDLNSITVQEQDMYFTVPSEIEEIWSQHDKLLGKITDDYSPDIVVEVPLDKAKFKPDTINLVKYLANKSENMVFEFEDFAITNTKRFYPNTVNIAALLRNKEALEVTVPLKKE